MMTEPPTFGDGGCRVDSPEAAADLGMKVGTIIRNIGVATDTEPSSVPIYTAFLAGIT